MQLTRACLTACVLCLWPSTLHADDDEASVATDATDNVTEERVVEVSSGLRGALYVDSDHTTIVTGEADASARFDQRWQLGARYLIDVVSSASIDVVVQASEHFDDVRHDMGATAGYRDDGGTSVLATYSYSTEHDWRSHNVTLGGSIDLLDRNLSLGLSLGVQDNAITRADTFGFAESLSVYLATASATYTLSPRDLVQVALSLSQYDGFQASPYRYITVDQMGYAEHVPDQRTRVALVGRYHRYLGDGFALRNHARLYTDSYGVSALTAGSELAFEHGRFDFTGFARGYAQSSARFYRRAYASQQRYMTIDKELSTFWDAFVGAAAGWSLTEPSDVSGLRLEARLAGNYFSFLDFARLSQRYGLTATLAISGNL